MIQWSRLWQREIMMMMRRNHDDDGENYDDDGEKLWWWWEKIMMMRRRNYDDDEKVTFHTLPHFCPMCRYWLLPKWLIVPWTQSGQAPSHLLFLFANVMLSSNRWIQFLLSVQGRYSSKTGISMIAVSKQVSMFAYWGVARDQYWKLLPISKYKHIKIILCTIIRW